jgi:hypothetical protein
VDDRLKVLVRETEAIANLLSRPTEAAPVRARSASHDITAADLWLTEPDGTDPRARLSEAQRRVIQKMLLGASFSVAVRQVGVHPERARRWTSTPHFNRALTLERAEYIDRTDPTPGMRLFTDRWEHPDAD